MTTRYAIIAITLAALVRIAAFGQTAKIHIEPIRGNMYMLAGSGGNITLQIGPDGIIMVDTGVENRTDDVLAAVQQAAQFHMKIMNGPRTPIRFIINTSIDPLHIGGNFKIAESKDFDPVPGGEKIIAQGEVLNRQGVESPAKASAAAPGMVTDAYFTEYYKLGHFFNGEGVQIIHVPNAHTDGDSIVWFRGSDVIAAGDVLETDRYPSIDLERGGSIKGVIDGLNAILDITYPEFRGQGGTMLVPGHGRLCYQNDVAYYRDMITIVRDRVQYLIDKKNTLEQIKAAKITRDYDPLYGTEPASTDRFIEAIYRSLTKK
jgi:glyoxylase-like metal-dependent hydrolase (beta-lactamase superfamily II)